MPFLVLNAGSSSLKFAVFDADSLVALLRGQVKGIGTTPELVACNDSIPLTAGAGFADSLAAIMDWLAKHGVAAAEVKAVGHRLVHGGTRFVGPARIGDRELDELEKLRALAPLHLPFGLSVLRATRKLFPNATQVACFDTAFHATQPDIATRLPLPKRLRDKGYRRYGFHGLSYAHLVATLPKQTGTPLPRRLLAAHLGSGASMCAILDGKSVGTTMGFSTADGLVMGTRTGSIDPGVILALLRDEGLSLDGLEDVLYRQSGLLGLSGISPDMRVLLASSAPAAKDAVDYYCYTAARHAASLIPALGGLDAIAFTGGVGENAEPVRRAIVKHLDWLGVPPSAIHVVKSDEEGAIAHEMRALLSASPAP